MRSSPAVLVEGPRACGKTWTGRRFADSVVRFEELPSTQVKLGGADAIASAVASLRRVRSKVDTQQAGEPSRLIVLTSVGRAFETVDDIAVVPITLLGP